MTKQIANGLRWTLLVGVVCLVLMVVGFLFWDQPIVEAIRTDFGKSLKNLARALSRYGDFPWLLGGGLIGLAFCLMTKQRDWARIIVAMLLAGILAGLSSNLIKLGTGRVRPRVENIEHGWYGPSYQGSWVSLQNDFQAFPSSHSACAFGFFMPLFLSRRFAGSIGLMAAAAVAWSRVQLNAHHLSDVAAGALIGVVAGCLVWHWIVERGGLSCWFPSLTAFSRNSSGT